MKNDKNDNLEINVKGKLNTEVGVESQNPTNQDTLNSKSGGNTPSDLGAIGGNAINSKANSSTRSQVNRPTPTGLRQPNHNPLNHSKEEETTVQNTSTNSSKFGRKRKKEVERKKEGQKSFEKPSVNNPLLNQNKMKGFLKNKKPGEAKTNPSASFMEKAKGIFSGKGKIPHLQGSGLLSSLSRKKSGNKSVVDKFFNKKPVFGIAEIWAALPIQIKIAIIGGGIGIFILIIVIVIVIATNSSAADANREMKEEFLQGNYTRAELCEYLDRNGYLSLGDGSTIKCEDTSAYQFFINYKELMDEYETKYARYRFTVNVELLYETLAYHYSDEEMYDKVTKEEIKNLIDAMLEEVEESCVIKSYDKKTKVCTRNKYVYKLYEFSLNKYISYLKYGLTSLHPNYGNDKTNKSSNGKSVTRICGEGKNVDYVFGFGLVNTSSSPLTESSNCPGEEVTEKDYEENNPKITTVRTDLEKLDVFGGVPRYSRIYQEKK